MKKLLPQMRRAGVALAVSFTLTQTIVGAPRKADGKRTAEPVKTAPTPDKKPAALAPAAAPAEEPLSFNFQIRPILAENCYACHGQDEKKRKGKLRLDVAEEAIKKGAIKPGDVEGSELVKRFNPADPDDLMPPADSHRKLTEAQKDLLKKWIAQGAKYEPHWSFVPPVAAAVPQFAAAAQAQTSGGKSAKGKNSGNEGKTPPEKEKSVGLPTVPAHFPIHNEIDAFVLHRLIKEGVQPAPKSDRTTWLRRVTQDLTGLPATLAEIDAFEKDPDEKAYVKVVDRLLASPAFGERMASDWLDAARYSDTYGRHEDAESPVWPYRDWVVRAFNANMPYDQFLTEQTAGDLLQNPTRDQLIATVFNRLVQQSNEAGSNEEEFRQEHVADRVRTNGTAILGLSMECVRCHDHKYDPITMKDYYSFSAFLNNINELGLYARQTSGIPAPSMLMYEPEAQEKHDDLTLQIAAAEAVLKAARESGAARFVEWQKHNGTPKAAKPVAWYRFDFPAHIKKSEMKVIPEEINPKDPGFARVTPDLVEGPPGHNSAVSVAGDFPLAFGNRGIFRRSDAFSFSFWHRPSEEQERSVLMHRTRGGLDAASRGYEIILEKMYPEFALSHFAPDNSIRIRGKEKLPVGKWTHIGATYDGSSKAAGLRLYINGKLAECTVIADNLYRDILYRKEWGDFDSFKIQDNGTPTVDLSLAWRYNDMGVKNGAFDEFRVFDHQLFAPEMLAEADGKPEDTDSGWFDAYLRDNDPEWQAAWKKLHDLRTAQDDLVNDAQEIMVMKENPIPRETFVLTRGQWDQKGEKVAADVPLKQVFPMPAEFPKNRLGLAKWYVDRRNPLTARVVVNRFWQIFFGRGIVGTAEEFGIQGELPSHPQLLDWLAVDFMDHGWDVKRLCKTIALSSTYRQSSLPSDRKLLADDPQNRLLARGPRHRLSAEQVRDTALAISGLLVDKAGGPPVKPYQTPNLYQDSGVQAQYEQDHGDSLWRRSVYCFWKRTMPLPVMTVFDGPTREFCKMRRERTNTPLQALALLNAPEFVECARVLAQKQLHAFPNAPEQQVSDAFRRCTGRAASKEEVDELMSLLKDQKSYYETHVADAETFVKTSGEAPRDAALSAVDVAAMSMVARVLLSHEETVIIH